MYEPLHTHEHDEDFSLPEQSLQETLNRKSFYQFVAFAFASIFFVTLLYTILLIYCTSYSSSVFTKVYLAGVADCVISISYFLIPYSLVCLVRMRKDLPFHVVFVLFSMFILSCGITHTIRMFAPLLYRTIHQKIDTAANEVSQGEMIWLWVEIVIKMFTALISLVTALTSQYLVPAALKLPAPSQLREEIKKTSEAQQRIQQLYNKSLIIYNISKSIRNTLDAAEIIKIAATQIGEKLGACGCSIFKFNADRTSLECEAEYIDGKCEICPHLNQSVDVNDEFLAAALRSESAQSEQPDNSKSQFSLALRQCNIAHTVSIRTAHQGTPNGIILLHTCNKCAIKHELSTHEGSLGMLEEIASQVGVALFQAHLLDQEKQRLELQVQNMLLQKEIDAAAKTNLLKSQFLALFSHEIRTPCNSVFALNSLLMKSDLTPQQKELVETISFSCKLLLGILNNFLDFSKLEHGKVEIVEEPFDIRKCILKTLAMFTTTAKEQNSITITCDIDPTLPNVISSDKQRYRQILINLVSNAVKFTPQNGRIHVSITTTAKQMDEIEILTSVKDTGIGISEDHKLKLFQPFSQVDSSLNRKYPGTGLGLVLSMQLCKLLGGTMNVDSTEGKGSTFFFTIRAKIQPSSPLAENLIKTSAALVADRKSTTTAPESFNGLKVLVAEDNQVNQKVIQLLLEKLGVKKKVIVGDGRAAIERYEQEAFDFVLMDLMMPEVDGLEATESITRAHPDAKIVILTACAQNDLKKQCLEKGAIDFLTKPIKIQELQKMFLKHLEQL